jgi:hypothetical protein
MRHHFFNAEVAEVRWIACGAKNGRFFILAPQAITSIRVLRATSATSALKKRFNVIGAAHHAVDTRHNAIVASDRLPDLQIAEIGLA